MQIDLHKIMAEIGSDRNENAIVLVSDSDESDNADSASLDQDDYFDETDVSEQEEEDSDSLFMMRRMRRRRNAIIDEDSAPIEPPPGYLDVEDIERSANNEMVVILDNIAANRSSNALQSSQSRAQVMELIPPFPNVHLQEDLLTIAESSSPVVLLEDHAFAPSTSKRKLSSPHAAPSPKKAREASEEEEDADCCPICLEPWSNSGKHRLTSLKCGHLFGQKCIERWVKDALKCPQCNTKARKADIRVLYAKRLKAVDTTELTEALTNCEKEREKRRKKEMELAQVRMQYQMAMEECRRLKSQMEDYKNNQVTSTLPSSLRNNITSAQGERSNTKKFCHVKNVVISPNGNCRVMDYHAESLSLAISQPSPHSSFMPGFGVKKFSVADMKSTQFIIMHAKPIKDISFSKYSSLLLTASQDQTLKIMSLTSNTVVHTYKPQRPVWSCCWDQTNTNLLYAGLSNGVIACYDTRSITEAIYTISNPSSRCPIVSMYSIPVKNDPYTPGGLLVQTLEGVTFWQNGGDYNTASEYKPNYLPLEPGSCAGMRFCQKSNQCLITYRPGRNYNCTTHLLCQLQFNGTSPTEGDLDNSFVQGGVTSEIVESFYGGQAHKMLTRNALFSTSSGTSFACVGDEAKNIVNIYDTKANGNKLLQALSCSGPALDILPVEINDRQLLATLTDKEIKLYEQK